MGKELSTNKICKIITRKIHNYFVSGYIILLSLISLFLFSLSCNNPTGPVNNKAVLTVNAVSCTEAWLSISANNIPLPVYIVVKRNGAEFTRINLSTKDTTIYDSTLSPNQTYIYQMQYVGTNANLTTTARTMDTTSHNITWQTYTFGGNAGSCNLYDVSIVDVNNIWAVGEIYLTDSSGNYISTPLNAVQWDGTNWKYNDIPTASYNDYIGYDPIKTIFSFNLNDIWTFSIFGGYSHWNGKNWVTQYMTQRSGGGDKLWGASSSNLYLAGTNGSFSYFNGQNWQKIECGTTTDIHDIWGYVNAETGITSELCAVSFIDGTGDKKILRITDNKVSSINWNMDRRVNTVWTKSGFPIYAGGDGIFENKRGYWKEYTEIPRYYVESIRGNDVNDIYAVGDFGLFAHYNGVSWKVYNNLLMNGIYFSVVTKGDLVVAVGSNNGQAIITVGKRN
jgi:hypothetical protein